MSEMRDKVRAAMAAKKEKPMSEQRQATRVLMNARKMKAEDDATSRAQINKPLSSTEGYDNTLMIGPFDTGIGIPQDTANTWAGVASGVQNMGQGIGNMLGLVDDETVMANKQMDQQLSDTTAGSIGQFAGETAALAPLGVIGKGAQAAQKLSKLPSAIKALTGAGTVAAAEGGLGGAIAANPNERGTGALVGAGGGMLLNKAMAGLSRVGKDGLVKTKQSADDLLGLVKSKTGKDSFIPLGQAADVSADASSAKGRSYADFASLLPSAKAKMEKQAGEFADDMFETNLRQVFQKGKGDVAVGELTKSGDMQRALEAAKNAGKTGTFSPTQGILNNAARGSVRGKYSPRDLINASENFARSEGQDLGYAPMREVGNKMQDVMGDSVGDYTIDAKDAYRTLSSSIGAIADKVPGLGSMVASKEVQKFLMGNNAMQKALQEAVDSGNGQVIRSIMSDIRRAMSVQPVVEDEVPSMEQAQEYVKQLRGQ